MENKIELVRELNGFFVRLWEYEIEGLYNQYADFYGKPLIYDMEDFLSGDYGSMQVADFFGKLSDYNSFNFADDYVWEGNNGIESTSNIYDWVNFNNIIDHIIENDDDLQEVGIRQILDKFK